MLQGRGAQAAVPASKRLKPRRRSACRTGRTKPRRGCDSLSAKVRNQVDLFRPSNRPAPGISAAGQGTAAALAIRAEEPSGGGDLHAARDQRRPIFLDVSRIARRPELEPARSRTDRIAASVRRPTSAARRGPDRRRSADCQSCWRTAAEFSIQSLRRNAARRAVASGSSTANGGRSDWPPRCPSNAARSKPAERSNQKAAGPSARTRPALCWASRT